MGTNQGRCQEGCGGRWRSSVSSSVRYLERIQWVFHGLGSWRPQHAPKLRKELSQPKRRKITSWYSPEATFLQNCSTSCTNLCSLLPYKIYTFPTKKRLCSHLFRMDFHPQPPFVSTWTFCTSYGTIWRKMRHQSWVYHSGIKLNSNLKKCDVAGSNLL